MSSVQYVQAVTAVTVSLDPACLLKTHGLSVAALKPTVELSAVHLDASRLVSTLGLGTAVGGKPTIDDARRSPIALDGSKLLTTRGLATAVGTKPEIVGGEHFVVQLDSSKLVATRGLAAAAGKPDNSAATVQLDVARLLSTKGLAAAVGKPGGVA